MSYRAFAFLLVAVVGIATASAVAAQTIIDEWAAVKTPPPPALKPAEVDAKTTALLLLDFGAPNCGKRPRCVASVPKLKQLLTEARGKNMLVVHSLFPQITRNDILPDVAPSGSEPVVTAGANKFVRTDLEKILRDRGITTVIVTGTAAHGAVLNTASAAALSGFRVILPVDAMSAEDPYPEQYTAWHMANAPGGIAPQVTLTRLDSIQVR